MAYNNLAKIRKDKKVSAIKVGKGLGVTRQRVHTLENNRLTSDTAIKLEKVLDTNAFTILDRDVLTLQPRNQEDKDILLEIVKNIEVE